MSDPIRLTDEHRRRVNEIANMLMAEWARIEGPDAQVLGVSYVATWADLARKVAAAERALVERLNTWAAQYPDDCACGGCGRCTLHEVWLPEIRAALAPSSTENRAGEPEPDAWVDRHGDVWRMGDDGLMHTPETAPFSREHVEKKWGPLRPARLLATDDRTDER